MKKSAVIGIAMLMGMTVLTGCGSSDSEKESRAGQTSVTVSTKTDAVFVNNEENNESVAEDWLESQEIADGINTDD